jgi:hypothetical protein
METTKMKESLKEKTAEISKKAGEFSKKTSEFSKEKLDAMSKENIRQFAKENFSKEGLRKFLNEFSDKEKRLAIFYSVFYFVFISTLLIVGA